MSARLLSSRRRFAASLRAFLSAVFPFNVAELKLRNAIFVQDKNTTFAVLEMLKQQENCPNLVTVSVKRLSWLSCQKNPGK